MEQFALGVAASVVAAIITFTSRHFGIQSWHLLFSKVYPTVSGVFEVKFGDKPRQKPWFEKERQCLELRQYGKTISGKYKIYDDNNLKMSFPISGFVTTDKVVVLNYHSTDSSLKGAGAFVLSIQGVNKSMSGKIAYVCSQCDCVHEFPIQFQKLEDAA